MSGLTALRGIIRMAETRDRERGMEFVAAQQPSEPRFASLLRQYRTERGLSQRAVALAAGVDPAVICRMEQGSRGPSSPQQALAIADALDLDDERADALLASAGYPPRAYWRLGAQDPTLAAVLRVLSNGNLSERDRREFRQVVELLAEKWLGAAAGTPSQGGPAREQEVAGVAGGRTTRRLRAGALS